jgi:hypothetical protein
MVDDARISKPTAGAQRAFGLAQLVNKVFVNERIPSTLAGHPGYRVDMSGPEAMSTSAHKRAIHQLALIPAGETEAKPGDGGSAPIVIGKADTNLSQLELRTYGDLQRLHRDAFHGEAFPIESAPYEALRTKVQAFFERQGIDIISSETRSQPTMRPSSVPPGKSRTWIFVLAGVLLAGVAIFFYLKR